MNTFIIVIQIVGAVTLLLWLEMFALSLLPLGIVSSSHQKSKYLNIIPVFIYPIFLGISNEIANSRYITKNYNAAFFWSIIPLVIFAVIFYIVKQQHTNFRKSIKH